ncbi:hypothetical protein V3C99_003284 [Haemonchus contortus]
MILVIFLCTLEFRGEALNALCALASITVITRHRSDHLGTKLRFGHSGNIIESVSAARSVGATVIVENLFETLPVRRKEFEKTSKKRQWKMVKMRQLQPKHSSHPTSEFDRPNFTRATRGALREAMRRAYRRSLCSGGCLISADHYEHYGHPERMDPMACGNFTD